MAAVSARASAKINLTLHVTGRRPDGYHSLDSLVVFADSGDRLTLHPAPGLSLTVYGPQAAGVPDGDENLILRAARLAGARHGAFALEKNLPPASGMGGGSSDAAAALRLLARAQGLAVPATDALMRLGADLPVCMEAPRPCRMQGLGERVEPLDGLPALDLVLVNDGLPLATPAVFKALATPANPPMPDPLPRWSDGAALVRWLGGMRNDLEAPARALMPAIGALLAELAAQPGCLLARMTGSGATCFGAFAGAGAARAAASALARPGRFCVACRSVPSNPATRVN